MEYFPLPQPRPQQVQSLHYVQEVLAKGYRDIVLESPTGVGKSAIAACIAAWAHENLRLGTEFKPGAYILVQQKVLQDQMEAEMERLGGKTRAALIKASVEYQCPMFKRCSVGLVDRRCACVGLGQCAYKLAKGRFLGAPVAVTNYAYYFTERRYVQQIEPRHVLVCDECHNLSSTILRAVDVAVSEDKLAEVAPDVDVDDFRALEDMAGFLAWLEADYVPAVTDRAEILAALSEGDDQAAKDAYEVAQHLMKVTAFIARAKENRRDWVFWREESRDGKVTLVCRPLDAAPYFDEMVGRESPVRIYLSAFPGPKAIFCRELGLDPQRVAWMRQSSPFPVEHRPVHLLSVGSMSRSRQEETLPAAMRMVCKIAETNSTARGIVHTHSYKLADAVAAALGAGGLGRRVFYPKSADEREIAMKAHAQSTAGILVSPSVGEGFDFRGDLARWQILCKCPYPSLGSAHTAALAERDPAWYKAETAKHLLQICGRVCRSADDHGETYILDSDVSQVLRETGDFLPRWFRSAVLTAKGEPFFGA